MTQEAPFPLSIAAIGCGSRTQTYFRLAGQQPGRYRVVAGADPLAHRVSRAAELSGNPEFRSFASADAILAEPCMADLMVIGTQDATHREFSIRAMEKGYDLLLEKPIATSLEDVLAIEEAARRHGRRVLICHVLRYTPLYGKIKAIVASGQLGDLVSLSATEGVEAWHQAHSFVRGHWAVARKSSPMILAKCCHDLDIIRWLVDRPCQRVSSFGALSHFKAENAPEGAPARCRDGCPVEEQCPYNAARYLGDKRDWLHVCDLEPTADEERLADWVHHSPWGRCVYRCDNDVVDHQTVNLVFSNEATATLTMTAFAEGRQIEIYGTKARLHGTRARVVIQPHDSRNPPQQIDLGTGDSTDFASHGGGDEGLMAALHEEMMKENPDEMTSSLRASVESHRIAFAAEESRLTGLTVEL